MIDVAATENNNLFFFGFFFGNAFSTYVYSGIHKEKFTFSIKKKDYNS